MSKKRRDRALVGRGSGRGGSGDCFWSVRAGLTQESRSIVGLPLPSAQPHKAAASRPTNEKNRPYIAINKKSKEKGKPANRPARRCKKKDPARTDLVSSFFFRFFVSIFVSPLGILHTRALSSSSSFVVVVFMVPFFFLDAAACLLAGPPDKSALRAEQKSTRGGRASAPSGPSYLPLFGLSVCPVDVIRDCVGPLPSCSRPSCIVRAAQYFVCRAVPSLPHAPNFFSPSAALGARAYFSDPSCLSLFRRWWRRGQRRTCVVDHTYARTSIFIFFFHVAGGPRHRRRCAYVQRRGPPSSRRRPNARASPRICEPHR